MATRTSGRTYHPWAEVVLLVDVMAWPLQRSQEALNLEQVLAQRLGELTG